MLLFFFVFLAGGIWDRRQTRKWKWYFSNWEAKFRNPNVALPIYDIVNKSLLWILENVTFALLSVVNGSQQTVQKAIFCAGGWLVDWFPNQCQMETLSSSWSLGRKRVKAKGGYHGPISVSFLIRTTGKEYHIQAGSTRLPKRNLNVRLMKDST